MHIIKISPVSFKIILSKEDLKRHGIENISENSNISGDFFAEIIDKTNALYGSPFKEGAIDAEFFESKDGGGELFISRAKHNGKKVTYLFRTNNSEPLSALCKRLLDMGITNDSRLYFDDGKYSLLMILSDRNDIILPILKEYGNASEISRLQTWLLEEHAKIIIQENAVKEIAGFFT